MRPCDGLRLAVEFFDGTSGWIDLSKLVAGERAGVFASLREPERFAEVFVHLGAVTWPGGMDLAPDAMYDEIRAHGGWAPE